MRPFLGEREMPAAAATLGLEVVSAGGGACELTFVGRPEFANLAGAVQGGFVCAMLDSTASCALLADLELDQFAPTIELKTNFLRPVPLGNITGRGRVVHRGGTIAFLEGALYDPSDTLLATATVTAKIVRTGR